MHVHMRGLAISRLCFYGVVSPLRFDVQSSISLDMRMHANVYDEMDDLDLRS